MIRRVVMHAVAVATGVAVVTALTKQAGAVPSWVSFLCGWSVTLASLANLRVRVDLRDREESDDESSDSD